MNPNLGTGARAALTQQITAQITAQTGDAALAKVQAAEIIGEKQSRGKAAVGIGAFFLMLAGLSYVLGMPTWLTMAIPTIGGIGVGVRVSPEYCKAWAKDVAEIIVTFGGAFRNVKDGGSNNDA